MANGRPQAPIYPRSHSYGRSSKAPFVDNVSLAALYEGFIITPSESRDEDNSSQDRWFRARHARSPATDSDLEAEVEIQKNSKRTAQQDLCSISNAKRDQIMGLIEGRERSNPGFTYSLVALKLERGHIHDRNSTRKHDHRHKEPKNRKESTTLMQIVLKRNPGQKQASLLSTGPDSSIQGVVGSTGSTEVPDRQPGEFVSTTHLRTHINTPRPQYLPPYVQQAQRWSNETGKGPIPPATQSQASQQVQPRLPMPIPRRRDSNSSRNFHPTPSSSSSSLDSAESAPPRKSRTISYRIVGGSLPSQHSGYDNGQPLGLRNTPSTPWPSASTPKGHPYAQSTPKQTSYQQLSPVQHRSEYPFPSIPPRLYVSSSTQTDTHIPNWSQLGTQDINKNLETARGKAFRYTGSSHAGKTPPKDLPSSEDDITIIEDSDDGYEQSNHLPEKESRRSNAHQKPAWMNNLVPVTPPAIAEGLLGVPRRRSNPMSPIVEDAVDASDSHTDAPKTSKSAHIDDKGHGGTNLADESSDEKLSERTEKTANASGHTTNSNGGRHQAPAQAARKSSPDHGNPRPEQAKPSDINQILPSLRTSDSCERTKPDSRRGSGSSFAEPEYFALRPNDYADEKPRSPNKRVTFSLPPSPSYGPGSRSTSPAETPPSSSRSGSASPIIGPSATRPQLPRQRSSLTSIPPKPIYIDNASIRPPLLRQSQSSSSYRPKERSPPRAKDSNQIHLASAPASFADLEKHERDQRHGNGNAYVRYEHVCPYLSCKGLGFGVKEDLKDHEYELHRKSGGRWL